ncbi:MAG: NUDIX domain-containing protein [Patescibacteria group bacterium]
MEYERPKVGLGVLVVRNGKILIGKRIGAHGSETWAPPGGHLEKFETWQTCAAREVEEETALKISNPRFVGVTNDIMREENRHYITLFVQAECPSGEPLICEPNKCTGWEWRAWEELPDPLFIPIQNLMKSGYHPLAKKFDKLVRDRIPEIIQERGEIAMTHEANQEEYKKALQTKLVEELEEYLDSEEPEELADLLEVIHSLTALHGTNREQLQLVQKQKHAERGGFEKRIILEETRSM